MLGPNRDLGMLVEASVEREDDNFRKAEYAAINSMWDQIKSCLDHLVKNDHLYTHFQEPLDSNCQPCCEFQQQLRETPTGASP